MYGSTLRPHTPARRWSTQAPKRASPGRSKRLRPSRHSSTSRRTKVSPARSLSATRSSRSGATRSRNRSMRIAIAVVRSPSPVDFRELALGIGIVLPPHRGRTIVPRRRRNGHDGLLVIPGKRIDELLLELPGVPPAVGDEIFAGRGHDFPEQGRERPPASEALDLHDVAPLELDLDRLVAQHADRRAGDAQ